MVKKKIIEFDELTREQLLHALKKYALKEFRCRFREFTCTVVIGLYC